MAMNKLTSEKTLTLEEAKTALEWVLRNVRRVKEMHQKVLGEKAWISLPTVQRMEGWNTPLTFEMLMQVCMALNIRLSTIILILENAMKWEHWDIGIDSLEAKITQLTLNKE